MPDRSGLLEHDLPLKPTQSGLTWNYRVVRRTWPEAPEEEQVFYAIHRVFYRKGVETPVGLTTEPIVPQGADVDELRNDFEMYTRAFELPILDYDTRLNIE
jgi:hypothetical protein